VSAGRIAVPIMPTCANGFLLEPYCKLSLKFEYFDDFEAIFENVLGRESRGWVTYSIKNKTRGERSIDIVPSI
jgi:hypothetical protein